MISQKNWSALMSAGPGEQERTENYMKKIFLAAFAAVFMSAGANADIIIYDVTRVNLGNQFTQGGGGNIPDVTAVDWGGRVFYDTDADVLYGRVSHQSGASQAQYIYTADWVIDFSQSRLIVLNLECTYLGGNDACLDYTNGVQAGPATVFSGNIADGTIGNQVVVKWNTLGAPFASAFINTQLTVVPVPAAAWLFASGLGLMAWIRRRNRV